MNSCFSFLFSFFGFITMRCGRLVCTSIIGHEHDMTYEQIQNKRMENERL
jgi:hypothetical protein